MQQEAIGSPQAFGVLWPALVHLSSVLGALLALLLVAQILRSPRMPAASFGWLIAIIAIPFFGIPLYLAFGVRKLKSRFKHKGTLNLGAGVEAHAHPVHTLLVSLGVPSSSVGNRVELHHDGRAAYHHLIALLNSAARTIDIAIFILAEDRVGREILDCLVEKAARGVQVRLLLDGVGSFRLPKARLQPLVDNAGRIAWFIPVIHRPLRGRTNLRNHRKIVIIDQDQVWAGGRNLVAEDLSPGCPHDSWYDLSFCLRGPAVLIYQKIFEADWGFATGKQDEDACEPSPTTCDGESRVQVVPSGPDVADDPLYAALLTACYQANSHIMAVTPYYLPDTGVQEAFRLAALRGVKVDLILPDRSNHRLADIARNRYLRELASGGVHVWMVPDTMVHAKAFIADNTFAMVGSANLDVRSLFLNYEVMSCFYTQRDVEGVTQWIGGLREKSIRYDARPVGPMREMVEGVVLLATYEL